VAIVFKNNASTTLSAALSSSATSITVADATKLPSITGDEYFFCSIDDGSNIEIVKVTGVSSNTLTIVREQDNTTAQTFSSGDIVEQRLTAAVLETFPQLDAGEITATEFIGDLRGAVIFKAQAGEAIDKGEVVYVSGISGNTPVVALADADDSSKMPAFGLALESATLNNSLAIITFGTISGVDTDTPGFSLGDTLYVSTTPGALTNSPPTGESSLLQNIGKVQRVHASSGSIKVGGAGRTNAVPNLNDGNIFIGNASNQATTSTLDTSIVPENTNLYYTDARAQAVSINNVVEDTTPQLGGDLASNGNDILFADSDQAMFGSGNDLRIFHNGTASKIQNHAGHFDIQNLANGLDVRFGSDDGAGGVANYFRLDGGEQISVASKNIRFEDGIKSTYGNSDDLQIYHTGTESWIKDAGTGNFYIDSNGAAIQLTANGATENMLNAVPNGGITLYHDNAVKLATSSTGIDVTGTITSSDSIILSGDATRVRFTSTTGPQGLEFGDTEANPNFRIYYRTSPNTLTFENNGESAKHTFDLSGSYTAAGGITSGSAVSVGTSIEMSGGVDNSIDFTGTGTDTTSRKFAYEASDDHYVTNRHGGGDLVLMSNNGTNGGETVRIRLQGGSGTQDIDITNANLDMNSNNIKGVGTINSGAITSTGEVEATALDINGNGDISGNLTLGGYLAGPATFTIDPAAVGDNTGTVVIAGNLQIDGTTTTINSTTVNIDDLNIQLATGAINAAAANGAGLTVDCGSDTDATFTYDGTNDKWDFNKNATFSGTISSGAITSTSYITASSAHGGVSLTHNDGYGNANVTFNHRSGVPEQNGQAARIAVNTDGTGTEGIIEFEVSASDVTSGTAVNLTTAMVLAHDFVEIPQYIYHYNDTDTYLRFSNDRVRLFAGGSSVFDGSGQEIRLGNKVQIGDTTNQNQYGFLQVNQEANNDESGIAILDSTDARSMRLWVDDSNSYINSGNGGAAPLILNEAITVSSGGNLTGVGTISSGAISATSIGVTNIVTNKVVKFNGSILDDSNITDTGSLITLGSNTTVSGTINSGAITSSGNLHAGDGTDISMDASANGQLEVDGNGYQGAIALDANAMHLYHNSSSRSLVLGTNETARLTISGTGGFDFESNPVQGITTFTSSGNITTSQHIQLGSGYNLSWGGTYAANKPTIAGAGGFIAFYPTGATDGEVIRIDADGIDMNSHNLTEVGTISSGIITSTGADFSSTIEVNGSGTYAIVDNGSVGWSYSPQESGVASVRYFLLFNYDNNASYPYLTNRTPSGRVSIYAGTAAGAGENEKIRVNGGDGTTEIDMFGTLDMNTNNITSVGAITSSGNVSADTLTLTAGNDNLTITSSADDWYFRNAQQNNGLVLYNGAGGIDIQYAGTSVQKWDSDGGTNLISGSFKMGGSEIINSSGVYLNTISSSQVTTALGYTPYQEDTALSATTGVFSSTVNIDRELRLDARGDGGDGDNVLAFKDSSGNYSIRQNVNDGNGNYSISIGYSGVGNGQYAVTGDGAGKVLFGGHGRDGAVSINAAPTGTAGNDISFSIGLLVDGSDNTIRVGAPANGTGLDLTAGTKVFDASANAFATSYSVGVNEVISSTRVGTFPSINLDDQIISTGDTNTYMQFHAADQWRVVTGGSERLEVNNNRTAINNGYLQITGSDSHLIATTTATASTVRIGKTASTRSAIVFDTSSTGTTSTARTYTIENAAGDRLRIGNPDHPEALAINSSGNATFAGNITAPKLYINNGTTYGVGIVNGASARFDTVDSGNVNDPLELCYYSGNGVRIGPNGGDQYLSAGSIQITGDTVISSGRAVTAVSYGSPANTQTLYNGFNGVPMVQGVNGAAYYHGSDNAGYGIVIQGGHPICKSVKIGSVNAGTTVIDSSRQLTNISAILGNSSSGGTTTFNVGRGDVYFENNGNSNANGAGITLRTGTNPTTGSIFDVRSSGQACRFFSGQSITTAGINPFYVGAPSTGTESTAANYAILLNTNGDIKAEGNITAYGTVSDIRQKENIEQIDKPIERLEKIKGVTFNYKKKSEDERLMGVIAQDLLKDDILKLAVYEQEDFKAEDDDPLKHTYGVRYEHLTAILIEAVKEQQEQIESLKNEINNLKGEK
jgi:hypothetical protein